MTDNLFNKKSKLNTMTPNISQDCGCEPIEDSNTSCPHCGSKGGKISAITIEAQLKEKNLQNLNSNKNSFNFCDAAMCPIVYYSDDQSEIFNQIDIKNKVSIKNTNLDTPLCYCQNLTKRDVLTMIERKEKNIVEKIKTILHNGVCSCEQTNPRGVTCAEDLTIFLLKYGIIYDTNTTAYKEYEIIKRLSSCCGEGNIKLQENTSCCR